MSLKQNQIQSLTFTLLLLTCSAGVSRAQSQASSPVKITNANLHSIDYGIESLMHWIQKARPGDASRASSLRRDHGKLVVRFNRIPNIDDEQHKYVASRLSKALNAIEALTGDTKESSARSNAGSETSAQQVARAHLELSNLVTQLNSLQLDITRYRDNHKQRNRMRSDLATLKNRFDRLPDSDTPDYDTVRAQLKSIEISLQPSSGPVEMNAEQVSRYLSEIQLKYRDVVTLPDARDIMNAGELTAADVDGILGKMKTFDENANADLPKLKQIVEATGQGEYWRRWLETESFERLKSNLQSIKAVIDKRITTGLRNAKQRSELDPETNRYAFSNDAMRIQHEAEHTRTLRTIDQATRLEQALGLPVTWSPKRSMMQDHMATYAAKVRMASSVRELPKEVGSSEHHAITRVVFANKKYGVGEIVKAVIASKPVHRKRIEHKARSGGIETIVRKWQQFQVITVEREAGKLFVYVNDIANYTQAPNPTPTGKWIMKQRFKRGEIDPSNVKRK